MKVYGNTQTDGNSLNCEQGVLPGIQESKYQPIRGKWMKEGKVWDGVQAFLLLCLHQLNSPIFHSDYALPTAALPAPSHRTVRLESFALFEVSVRDIGSNRRKKLISPRLIPSLALFVPLPLKSFVFEFVAQIIFSRRTKATRKPPPPHDYEINHMFFSLVCRRINRKSCVCCCWIVRIARKHSAFSYRT